MLESFLKFLEFEKRSSIHTITSYGEDLRQLLAFLASAFEITDFTEVQHSHLRNWVIELMEDGISANSINRKIASVKSFYKFLKSREYLSTNPASRLKPLKTEKRLPAFVQENDLMQLLDGQAPDPDDVSSVRDHLILELFYGSGIRLSELIGLKNSDVNFYDNTIKVLGKRNKERIIPIPQSIVNNIRKYQDMAGKNFSENRERLFLTDAGKPLYPMFVYRLVNKNLAQVSTLTKKSPHVLRHTFATHLLDKGADLNAVKDLLGHTSLAATQVYTHNSLEKLKSAFDQAHPKA